ncbi:MAG: signal peptidase I [Frankiales bacterium]|nr:signal peptidase I [Frankiales bacterium]
MTSPETPAGPPTADEENAHVVDGAAPESTESADATAPPSSRAAGGTTTPAHRKRKGTSFWKELPFLVLIALVLALLIKTFLVQAFYIPSGSMENTLHIGDRVLVNKLVYRIRDVHRGEIIVFRGPTSWQDNPEFTSTPPSNPIARFFHDIGSALGVAAPSSKDFIKRVIGVGGDHVICCDTQGRITVNGHPLDEKSYLYFDPTTHQQVKPSLQNFDITVPKGRLWVMGDHRDESADSRSHISDGEDGTIPTKNVIGRAFVRVWPPSHWGTLSVPKTFHQAGLAAAAIFGSPLGLGFAGAIPLTLLRRRLRRRRRAAL